MDSRKKLGQIFNQIADAIETGTFGKKTRVVLTTLGSEHGHLELVKGAEIAQARNSDLEVILIGPACDTSLELHEVTCEKEAHEKMEAMLKNGEADAAVTMHYNFPVGVSTVGRVITPGTGREMIIATTTGTSDTHRVGAMVKNAIYGVATAKAIGIDKPKVGILNVDGARQCEKILKELKKNGYGIEFTESARADGGVVMRGNDLLMGTPDVMVTDTLTGNLLMKIFSSFTTGGSYEALGYGYGPGVGEDFDMIICILSRASGAPVVAGAIRYAADVAQGKIMAIVDAEIKAARKAGLDNQLEALKKTSASEVEEVKAPPKVTVDEEIPGVDILQIDDAVKVLWKEGIYAETGMGCTGPVVLVPSAEGERARELLKEAGYIL
ncbi:glycine reductase [Anoxybacter fermentans]|uniref:Glycine reductase n=1 Tax=Anoxybacter fermentans TaxID=1323375 RepID=A0A3Q9HSK3_9FIRM|nr:glycine reductase [Anoxybacter fermentans]